MKSRVWSRFFVVLATVFALLYILPSLVGKDTLPKWYTNLFSKTMSYGLDLQGGLELRYTVDYKKGIRDNTNRVRDTLASRIADEMATKDGKDPGEMSPADLAPYRAQVATELVDFRTFKLKFQNEKDATLVDDEAIVGFYSDKFGVSSRSGGEVTLIMPDEVIAQVRESSVNDTLKTFAKRIDAFGLVEPDIRRNGDTEIDVQLPGVDKNQMEVVRERLGQTAHLSFKLVDTQANFFSDKQAAVDAYRAANPTKAQTLQVRDDARFGVKTVTAKTKAELIGFVKTLEVPDGYSVGFELFEKKNKNVVQETYWQTMYLDAKVGLSGETLSRAMVLNDPAEGWYVMLELNSQGADEFGKLTTDHVKKSFAIMLDDDVNSAPQIREPILGGRARITLGGNRNQNEILNEARGMVTVLNHGAYKAPVHKIHDHAVGPTLGSDSIRSGAIAVATGTLLVVLFMIYYYRWSGMAANLALLVNIAFILATLVNFNTALTLPGMAGLVLTLGMAVDANVLIYERIREELRGGKSVKQSIEAGFDRAFWTIFDSQLTTALTAIILMQFSTGPIYGFAVTLTIGIVFSVLTAFFVTRMLFDLAMERRRLQTLSI